MKFKINALLLTVPVLLVIAGISAAAPPAGGPHGGLASRVQALEAQSTVQQNEINALIAENTSQQGELDALDTLLADVTRLVDPNTGHDTLRFSGMNVQVVNGLGSTSTSSGTGNLIIGYNELGNPFGDIRAGSHMMIAGSGNSYVTYGGIVVGLHNYAAGNMTSVSGGRGNRASAGYSSVSGGFENLASGPVASVSGGYRNRATGFYSSVSGGADNTASEYFASVSGGQDNEASGEAASVSGGHSRSAASQWNWRAGGLSEPD